MEIAGKLEIADKSTIRLEDGTVFTLHKKPTEIKYIEPQQIKKWLDAGILL